MSDNFDKNWLDDDNTPDEPNNNNDDLDFNWDDLVGDDDSPTSEPKSLGVTGMLDWKQGRTDAEGGASSDDDDGDGFDWQALTDEDGKPRQTGNLGFTGALSWRQGMFDEDDDAPQAAAPTPPTPDDAADAQDDEFHTGLTDLLATASDDDFSFLDGLEDPDDGRTGVTGLLESIDTDEGTGFTGLIPDDKDPSEPTGVTGLLNSLLTDDSADDDNLSYEEDFSTAEADALLDSSAFLGQSTDFDDAADEPIDTSELFGSLYEEDDEPLEPLPHTGLTSLFNTSDESDFAFLDGLEPDDATSGTGVTGLLESIDSGESSGLTGLIEEDDAQSSTGVTGLLNSLGMDDDDTDDAGDFLVDSTDDFDFASLGIEDDAADDADFFMQEAAASTDDFDFASLGIEDDAADDADFFMQEAAASTDDFDLDSLDFDDDPPADDDDSVDDFFAEMAGAGGSGGDDGFDEGLFGGLDDDEWGDDSDDEDDAFIAAAAVPATPTQQFANLDDLLDSFDNDTDALLQQSAPLPTGEFSFDDLESDDLLSEETMFTRPELGADAPEFLRDVSVGSDQASASALARQMDNVPDDELDPRLFNLRKRAQRKPSNKQPDVREDAAGELIPGVTEGIGALKIDFDQSDTAEGLQINREQRAETEKLRELVESDDLTAMKRTPLDGDALAALEDAPAKDRKSRRERKRRELRTDSARVVERLIVAGVLVAALVAAFFGFVLFGEEPATTFDDSDGSAAAVFESIGTIDPRSYVLFAVEYGPNAAAELDGIFENTVKHTLAVGGFPVIVGRNPVGVSRTQDIMARIAADETLRTATGRELVSGEDYYIAGYLPGDDVGLRSLVSNTQALLSTDINGNPLALPIGTLNDFSLIVVLADAPDDVRLWAEQVAPSTRTSLVAGVGRVTEVLARQYVIAEDGFTGLLVGQPDANVYTNLLNDSVLQQAVELASLPTRTPTLTLTPSLTPTNTPIGYVPSATPEGFIPTETPEGFIPYSNFGVGALVASSGGTINVRGEPSTTAPVVNSLGGGTLVRVQQELRLENGDTWTQVIFADGVEGWVSAPLLRAASEREVAQEGTRVALLVPTETPTITPTETPTETPTATATDVPTETPIPPTADAASPEDATPTGAPTDESAPPATAEIELLDGEGVANIAVAGGVNVRLVPSEGSDAVGTLTEGENVAVRGFAVGEDGQQWVEVRLPNGSIGYVRADELIVSIFPVLEGTAVPTDEGALAQVPTDTPSTVDGNVTLAPATATQTPLPTETATPTLTPSRTPTATPTPVLLDAGTVVITTGQTSINVRGGAGTEFDRVAVLRPRTRVSVVGNSDDGRWLEIRLPEGGTGFIFRDLVRIDSDQVLPTSVPTNTPTQTLTPTVTVTPSQTPVPLDADGLVAVVSSVRSVNVRVSPGRGAASLGPLNRGDVVNILSVTEDNDWLEILLPDGRVGYIFADTVDVLPGDSYIRFATATAEAGGRANLPSNIPTETAAPTNTPFGATQDPSFVEGRQPFVFGTSAQVKGIDPVNMRSAPTRFSSVVATLRGRETAQAITLSANGDWVLVRRSSGEEGWVSRPLLTVRPPTTPTVRPSQTPIALDTVAPQATSTAIGDGQSSSVRQPRTFSRVERVYRFQRAGEGSGTITAATANVRSGAGVFFDSVGTASRNDTVAVLSVSADGNWVEVRLSGGAVGFVQATQINITQPPGSVQASPTPQTRLIEGSGALTGTQQIDIRETASETARSLTRVRGGSSVAVLGFSDDGNWVQVRTANGREGFVLSTQITIQELPRTVEVSATEAAPTEGSGTIIAERTANVRVGPSLAFSVAGVVEPSAIVPVLDLTTTEDEGDWVQIRLADGAEGWVQANLIRVDQAPGAAVEVAVLPSETPTPTEASAPTATPSAVAVREGSGVVIASGTANVRIGPSLAFSVAGVVEPDALVRVLDFATTEDEGDWVQIRLSDGTEGWVQANLIRVDVQPSGATSLAQAADTPTPDSFSTQGEGEGLVTSSLPANVHAGPSTTFPIVGTLQPEETFAVRGFATDEQENAWLRVRLPDNTIGYIFTDDALLRTFPSINEPFESVVEAPPTGTPAPSTTLDTTGEGEATVLNETPLRTGPAETFEQVGILSAEASVALRGFETDADGNLWLRVRLPDDSIGYARSDDLLTNIFPELNEPFESVVALAATETPTEQATATDAPTEGATEALTPTPTTTLEVSPTADVTEASTATLLPAPELTPTPAPISVTVEIRRSISVPAQEIVQTANDAPVTIYSGADELFNTLGELRPEQRALGLGASEDGAWVSFRVPLTGQVGWARVENVTRSTPADAQLRPYISVNGVANNPAYEQPDTTSALLGRYAQDVQFVLVGQTEAGDWYEVLLPDGRLAWVEASIATLTGDAAQAASYPLASATAPLAVYSAPQASGSPQQTLAAGVFMDVLGFADGDSAWLQVRLPDATEGFVSFEEVVLRNANIQEERIEVLQVAPTPETIPQPDRALLFGLARSQNVGELDTSAVRQEFAVRFGLVVSAVLIVIGNLIYGWRARRQKRS